MYSCSGEAGDGSGRGVFCWGGLDGHGDRRILDHALPAGASGAEKFHAAAAQHAFNEILSCSERWLVAQTIRSHISVQYVVGGPCLYHSFVC